MSVGEGSNHLTPQVVRPDMTVYRKGRDTIMNDVESDSSEEQGWNTVTARKTQEKKAGKMRAKNAERDGESMMDINFEPVDDDHVEKMVSLEPGK